MSTETGMSDRKKFKALNRLSGLTRSAEELIYKDAREGGEVDLLLGAMQAFKEGKLVGIWCAPKSHQPKNVASVFDLEICNIALLEDDKQMLMKRGVRHLGELFYIWFDPRSAIANERGERIMSFVSRMFNLALGTDPLMLGWKPCYWGDPSFMAALNVLILERFPTPPAPDWERYVAMTRYERDREGLSTPEYRGIARSKHRFGKHFVGEIISSHDKRVPGNKEHCPAGRRGVGDLDSIARDLRGVGSHLWAAARIPSDWTAPDWQGELWQKETVTIAEEERAIEAIVARREEEHKAVEGRRLEAIKQRREEFIQLSSNDILNRRLDTFEFSVRTANCLHSAEIKTVGQLIVRTEADMLKIKNFGRKSLNEVKEALAELGLRLGMTATDFSATSVQT